MSAELQQKYQEVLKTCKKDLYSTYKVNWNDKDSIKYTYSEGSFTVNSVAKVANPSNNIVFVLFEEKEYNYKGEVSYAIHMLKLNEGNKLKFTNCEGLKWNKYVYSLFTQQDINSARKAATSYCIIQVPKSSIVRAKEETIQDFINNYNLFNNRIKVIKKEGYITTFEINGKRYNLNKIWSHVHEIECFCERLDKSGYYTEVFKLRRLSKLTKIHSNQVKEYLKSASYNNKMKELKELLNRIKEVYISKVQKVETYKDARSIERSVDLSTLYLNFEDLQAMVEKNIRP